jgi:hypothetical protein
MNKNKTNKRMINFVIVEEENNNIPLETILEKYKDSIFVPNNIINEIIHHYFPSYNLLHKYSANHLVIKVNILDFLKAPIENCSFNRPADMARCRDIAHYTCNNKDKPLDTMFYICYNNLYKTLSVIDGIHRYTALKILQDDINKPLDLLTGEDSEFNININNSTSINVENEWFNMKDIIINIRFNYTEEQQMEIFRTINKSQPVPYLYIRNTSDEKKNFIEDISNEWQLKYANHFSGSSNPNVGNTNKNKFVDLLDKIYIKYKINETKHQEFKNLLEETNIKISRNIPKKIPEKTRERCLKSGCYLFLYKNDILEEMI